MNPSKLPDMELLRLLVEGSGELQISLTKPQREKLIAYLRLIQKWNRVYNLTAQDDDEAVLRLHILDSLSLAAKLSSAQEIGKIVDVGSGAGLPGVVLAIVFPKTIVHCVDTVGKKASFIQHAAANLQLPNLHGVHARIERLDAQEADIVTSRAFSSLADFVCLSRKHLKPSGVWMAMKGRLTEEERSAVPTDVEMFHVERLLVPGLAAERHLVRLRPKAK